MIAVSDLETRDVLHIRYELITALSDNSSDCDRTQKVYLQPFTWYFCSKISQLVRTRYKGSCLVSYPYLVIITQEGQCYRLLRRE